jgi:hypothetical protein
VNRPEAALGPHRCTGDGPPKAWCTLAVSAPCLHESRSEVDMDQHADWRGARHATFNMLAAGMDILCMLMTQVSKWIRPLATFVPGYTFGTALRAGRQRIDIDHGIGAMRCWRLEGILAYSSYTTPWRRRSALCAQVWPASSHFHVTSPSWPLRADFLARGVPSATEWCRSGAGGMRRVSGR